MTNHTASIRLDNDFLAEASPILDDATDYPADGPDEFLVRMAPVADAISNALVRSDWSSTIEVTADQAALLQEEAEFRLTFDLDHRARLVIERLVSKLKVIRFDLAKVAR